MTAKKKIGLLTFQILLLWLLTFLFAQVEAFTTFYSSTIYPAIQSGRSVLLSAIPFSIGDLLYIAAGLWALLTLIRWIYYIRKFGVHKDRLTSSVLNTVNVLLLTYTLFLLLWGGNYYKLPLAKTWKLKSNTHSKADKKKNELISFNKLLLNELQYYAPQYKPLPHKYINDRAIAYYRVGTDSKIKSNGLHTKSTLFGYLIQRMEISGYYNPFTGEGQINNNQPGYMIPFTVCHEIAHQAGIAAEGDANLLAYALCTSVKDPSFRYSAYLNLWLYANNRLHRIDSTAAQQYEQKLPAITRLHLDTLEQISKQYHGKLSEYTGSIYDKYLQTQQNQGLSSYSNVLDEAWQLERGRLSKRTSTIHIP